MSDQPPFDWDEGDAPRRGVGGRHFATSDDPDVPVDDDVAAPHDDRGYDDFDDDYGDDYLDSYDDDDYVEVRNASSRGRRALVVVLGILVVLVVAAAAVGLWVPRQIPPSGGPGVVRELQRPQGTPPEPTGVRPDK